MRALVKDVAAVVAVYCVTRAIDAYFDRRDAAAVVRKLELFANYGSEGTEGMFDLWRSED